MRFWPKNWTSASWRAHPHPHAHLHGNQHRRAASRSRRIQVEHLEPRTPLAADITKGLVHYWTFDETSGNIATDSVGGNDGELRNYGPTEIKWVPGKIGGAISFNDADDLVLTALPITQDQYTFSFWLNQTGEGGFNPRLINPADEDWLVLWQFADRGITFSDSSVWDPHVAARNTWEHYAVTLDQTTDRVEFYRSGDLVAAGTYPDKAPPIEQWVMGHSGTLDWHVDTLQGQLDDMRVYNRLLSPGEIQSLAGNVRPEPPTAGLVHYWTFDETNGDIAADSVGGNDGELRNFGPLQDKWVPGKIGGAIRFSEGDDLVVTQDPITLDQYTFSFWLDQVGEGGFNPRIAAPGGVVNDWVLISQFGNRGVGLGGSQTAKDPNLPRRNTWEHYAVVFDRANGHADIYRGGVQVATGTFNAPPPLEKWVFGHHGHTDIHVDTLDGMLDDLRIYNRLLSPTEIQFLADFQPLDARPDEYTAHEDVALIVGPTIGVQSNDGTAGAGTTAVLDVRPTRGQVSLNSDGSFTYTPAQDFNGPDRFTYHLEAGSEVSAAATVSLIVKPVNDPPSFNLRVPEFVVSDEQPHVFRASGAVVPSERLLAWMMDRSAGPLTAIDESGQTLTVSLTNDNPGLFAVQPVESQGRLVFTPAPNVRGSAVVTVKLQDSGGTADGGVDVAFKTFVITVVKPHPLHNIAKPHDVSGDGFVVAGDALDLINYLNAFGSQAVAQSAPIGPKFLDVTGDNFIAPDDALAIINVINAGVITPSIPGAAAFLERDSATQGNWQSKYGSAGYSLNSSVTNLPPGIQLSFTGGSTDVYDYVQAAVTTDPRALASPTGGARRAAEWTGDDGFTLNLNLKDGQQHRVSLYMLDWRPSGRSQKLEILDAATGQILDSQTLDAFGSGVYLSWLLRGSVKIRFTNLANGLNTVLGGIFFD